MAASRQTTPPWNCQRAAEPDRTCRYCFTKSGKLRENSVFVSPATTLIVSGGRQPLHLLRANKDRCMHGYARGNPKRRGVVKGKEKFVSIENTRFKSYVRHDDYSYMVKTSVRFRNPFKKGIITTAVKMTAILL